MGMISTFFQLSIRNLADYTAHASHHIYCDGAGMGVDCGVDSRVKFCAEIMAKGT